MLVIARAMLATLMPLAGIASTAAGVADRRDGLAIAGAVLLAAAHLRGAGPRRGNDDLAG
jgi:hypothetical protein